MSCISFKCSCEFLCGSHLPDWSVGPWRGTTMLNRFCLFLCGSNYSAVRYRQPILVEWHDERWQLPYLGFHRVWKIKAGQVWCSDTMDGWNSRLQTVILNSPCHALPGCDKLLSWPRTSVPGALEGGTLGGRKAEQVGLGKRLGDHLPEWNNPVDR